MTVQIAVTRKTVSIEIGPLQELATVRAIAESAVTPAELNAFALDIAGSTDAGLTLLRDEVEQADALKADKARTITGAGLAVGGGSLASNRTITVQKASEADAVDGTADDRAMTPLAAAAVTDPLDERATVQETSNPIVPDADYALPFTDADGATFGGIDHAGRLDIELTNPDLISVADADFALPFADEAGVTIGGIDHAGRLDMELANPEAPLLADANYALPFAGADGSVIGGVDHEGRWDIDLAPSPFALFLAGGRVKAARDGQAPIDISTGEFDSAVALKDGGNFAYWFGLDSGGAAHARSCFLRPTTSLSSSVTNVLGLIYFGQSLSLGASAVSVIHSTPQNPGRAVMFNAGVRVHGREHDDPAQRVDPENLRDWVDLHEQQATYWGETGAAVAAKVFLASAPSSQGICVAAVGVGGQPYSALKKGTAPFDNLVAVGVRMVQVARLDGRTMDKIRVFWRQGETGGENESTYRAHLVELQADVSAAIQAITGTMVDVQLIIDQISVFQAFLATGATWAQSNVTNYYPDDFVSLGPKYLFPYSDGLHLTALGYAWSAAWLGRHLARTITAGLAPRAPLQVSSAVRTGASVVLTFTGGDGTNLVIDHTYISNPGGAQPEGFLWRDNGDGNAVTVTAVAVTASRQVTLTLSATPTGSGQAVVLAGYSAVPGANGGPTTGPRCCVRDSAPETITISGTTYPLHNYPDHQIVGVS